jgi:hypothetical protein
MPEFDARPLMRFEDQISPEMSTMPFEGLSNT